VLILLRAPFALPPVLGRPFSKIAMSMHFLISVVKKPAEAGRCCYGAKGSRAASVLSVGGLVCPRKIVAVRRNDVSN
jgi:hypothetical protein